MAGSLLYVNARIKSLENGLLNNVQLSRLIEADDVFEVYKILQECGYGAGLAIEDAKSYENLIATEEKEAVEFLRDNLFKNSGLDVFLLKNDYHNAKVLIKAKYLRLDNVDDMTVPNGLLDLDDMKEDISNDDYSKLPNRMAEALHSIDVAFANNNRSPRMIDIMIDRLMFEDIYQILKKAKQEPLIEYLSVWIDTTNIGAFIRCKRLGLDYKFFIEGFIEKGTLMNHFYETLYEQSLEQFREKIKYTPYNDLVNKALDSEGGLVQYETAVDNYLLNIFKQNKYDMFSVAPIAGYYIGQMTEIKVVKLIISCIKNKVDKIFLRQRLRDLYA